MLTLVHLCAGGQDQGVPYFQQGVQYDIDVTLDDSKHELHGHLKLTYRNNSPEELKRIAFHLWPNAYQHKETKLAEQLLRLGRVDFYHAASFDLGFIDSLEFRVNGKKLAFSYDPEFVDVGWIRLTQPLKPGEEVEIETPFRVKIPQSFSRLGHVGESYQVTQWYPKPAVYDQNGWNIMPYLDQGEFYSEFGNFNVRITLPGNYLVAATGELITESELDFLYKKVDISESKRKISGIEVDTIPPSVKQFKTIAYAAENVHDFAWFADKRFRVDTSSLVLDNGRKVITWAFFTKAESEYWQNATTYLNRSIQFYSEEVGPYEWPQATAVQAPLSKGVGMEYPMITLIGISFSEQVLDQVITHEVGHNWFYGMIASNERRYAWLDEGINTFYENQYMQRYYGDYGSQFIPSFLSKNSDMRDEQTLYFDLSRQQKHKPGKQDPYDQSSLDYYLNAYEIPAKGLELLKRKMGEQAFREAMQLYAEKWKFKHPEPSDFQDIFEDHCQCDISWFVMDILQHGKVIDYAITGIQDDQLIIQNKGNVNAPIEIIIHYENGGRKSQWIDGFGGEYRMSLSIDSVQEISLYEPTSSLDLDWSDNQIRTSGTFPKMRPIHFGFGSGIDRSDMSQIFFIPALGINDSDHGMIGLGLSNLKLPNPSFRWIAIPMYSLHGKEIVGMGEIRKDLYFNSGIADRMTLRGSVKRFSYDHNTHYEFIDRYEKLEAEGKVHLRNTRLYSPVDQSLSFRIANIQQRFGVGLDFESKLFRMEDRSYYVTELQYERIDERVLSPSKLLITAHQGKGFIRLMGKFRQKITYPQKSKGLYVHLFAGALAQNDQPDANVNFIFNGQTSVGVFSKDYMYDEILYSRNATKGIFSQQVFSRDAELKTLSNVGISDSWMAGGGLSSSLPIPLPIHLYADFAFYQDPFNSGVQFSYSSGVSFIFAKDFMEVYFPLFESKDIRESLTYVERDTYRKKISFLFNLKTFHPFEMSDQFFEYLYR